MPSLILRSVEFGCNITLSSRDEHVLSQIRAASAKHFALTNDLYSYAKEYIAEQERGETLINAVRVLQNLLDVSAPAAKSILRCMILDIEGQIHADYERLLEADGTTEEQLRCARGFTAFLSGNMFFSATSERYARAVPGSRLD